MQFPRLVYKSASNHQQCTTSDEYEAALKAGWFGSVPEAAAGKHLPRVNISVTVYKSAGEALESFKAKDQAEADLFIGADGWFATKKAAQAAALKAEWPVTPADVDTVMGGLEDKSKAQLSAYAARIGAVLDVSAKVGEILAVIRARLEAGYESL